MDLSEFFGLSGKVAIVTGGGQGIGKEIALAMADAGANLVIPDLSLESAEQVAEAVAARSRKAIAIQADLGKQEAVEGMVKAAIERFGRVDILVNNAGITNICPARDYPLEDFQRLLHINLTGLFMCSQVVGNHMIEQGGGKIVNIASIAGMIGSPTGMSGGAPYHSSKAAVIGLTRQLAVEWGEFNVNVNAICPGIIATELTRARLETKEFKAYLLERTPIKKIGTPEDLIGGVVYLASAASDFVTGQTVVIDGGYVAM